MSKKFKKVILIGLVFVLGIYFTSSSAKALTNAEINAQITALQQQIAQLQQQLSELGGEQEVWCHTFNNSLRHGDSGTEVKALQTALEKEGFSISASEKSSSSFGNFTASAVVEFQEKYTSEILAHWGLRRGTGYVGATTRAKLNEIYGCGVAVKPYIRVVSPNGGEKFIQGSSYDIKWISKGVGNEVKITTCMTPASYEEWSKITGRCSWPMTVPNTGLYKNTIGRAAGLGEYTVRVEDFENSSIYDENDAPFTIISTQQEDLVSGTISVDKTSADTGEDITLTITAQDDQGVYRVRAYYQSSWHYQSCGGDTSCTKTWTFSESTTGNKYYYGYVYGYEIDGSAENAKTVPYYVKVNIAPTATTCTDSDGGKDYYVKGSLYQTNSAYQYADYCSNDRLREFWCTDSGQADWEYYECPYGCEDGACKPGITVTSPNGGETYVIGTGYLYIKYNTSNIPIGTDVTAYLKYSTGNIARTSSETVRNDGANTLSMNMELASSQEPGQYKIEVCAKVKDVNVCDSGDNYFSIVSEGQEEEDLVSGTISVDKTSASAGEDITLTITAQDDQGIHKIRAYYQSAWHYQYCGGDTSCTKTWTFKESTTGNKYYYGYVYGYEIDGSAENAKTVPYYVKVNIASAVTTCTDSDGGENYYVRGEIAGDYYPTLTAEELSHGRGIGETKIFMDYCKDTSILTEFYCVSKWIQDALSSGTEIVGVSYACPYGCYDGACKQGITVTSPNGGEKWEAGKTYIIRWDSDTESSRVVADVLNNQGKAAGARLPAVITNSGSIDWTVPTTFTAGQYKIRFMICPVSFTDLACANQDLKQYGYDGSDDYFSIVSGGQEDPVSGTISVDKTTASTGEDITLTITAQDDQGIYKVRAYYQSSWHYQYCGGDTSCTKTWTFKESTTGNKYYYGYVYGYNLDGLDGSTDNAKTVPYYVKVNVIKENKPDLIIVESHFTENGIVAYSIQNQGGISAGRSYSMLYINGEEKVTDYVEFFLPIETSSSAEFYDWTCTSDISYRVKVCADTYQNVSESNENNNCTETTLTCPEEVVKPTIDSFKVTAMEGYDTVSNIIPYDQRFTVSWKALNAEYCIGYAHYIPLVGGGLWSELKNLPTSGNKELYARHAVYDYMSPLSIGLQCFNAQNKSVSKEIFVKVSAPSCTDSDGGKDYYVKGHIIIDGIKSEDECNPGSDTTENTLLEYYCTGILNEPGLGVTYECPYGCEDGACKPGITVTSPNGGEEWKMGEVHWLRWDSEGVDNIDIMLEKWSNVTAGGPETWILWRDLPAWSHPDWQVGAHNNEYSGRDIPSGEYKIYIADSLDDTIDDRSDDNFSIHESVAQRTKDLSSMMASIQTIIDNLLKKLQEMKK